MKKNFTQFFVSVLCFFYSIGVQSQDTAKINFSGMTPHVGQTLYLRVVDIATNSEVGRTSVPISSAAFSVNIAGIMAGNSYNVDFFADHNKNRKYDAPSVDHAWRETINNVAGNTTIAFAHNTSFTDILWPHAITVALTNMTPHAGQNLYIALKDKTTGMETTRKKMPITMANFNVTLQEAVPGNSYDVDFFADHNKNGRYDAPPADHAWRLSVNSLVGDSTVAFVHNTNFTDIAWMYLLTVNFTGLTPHLGQLFKFYLRDQINGSFIDSATVNPIATAGFSLQSWKIMPGSSYNVDFYADHNGNGMYNAPPVDHAWRMQLSNVMSDTALNFAHNTNFTDIFPGPTAIAERTDDAAIRFYPNPAGRKLYLNFNVSSSNKRSVKIYNSSGALVKDLLIESKDNTASLDLSDFASGLFILQISDGKKVTSHKFVKQ
jgi:hypothetical protein